MADNHLEVDEEDYSRSCTPESLISGTINNDLYSDEEEILDEDVGGTIALDLETLTDAGNTVNQLKLSILEAKKEYESFKQESTKKLAQMRLKYKSSIDKTEIYVRSWRKVKAFHKVVLLAASKFERSYSEYESAKETLKIAERSIAELEDQKNDPNCRQSPIFAIDTAWQETLANATLRVQKAEKDMAESNMEHEHISKQFETIQKECRVVEMKYKRAIRKSKPYYEERYKCNQKLVAIKNKTEELQRTIEENKTKYKKTLKHLEYLSGFMHEERVRRRTNSCLSIARSEPDLIGQRSLTPTFPLEHTTAKDRASKTPDSRLTRMPYVSQPTPPTVRSNNVTGEVTVSNGFHSDIRQMVATCLTNALSSYKNEQDQSIDDTTTSLTSIDNDSSDIRESAREIVAVTLSRAIGLYQNDVSNHHDDFN